MSINLSVPRDEHEMKPRISVVGVGGAGGNAVNNMIRSNLIGCEFLICNTDAQAMMQNLAERRIQLGVSVTRGLGAGSRPDVGRAAAEEALDEIMQALHGSNMVFITAGMGGGTGTGAAPVIARAAREAGILTVGVVTKPFHFEGSHRMRLAEAGMIELQKYVDTLIIIPNQNLFRVANEKTTFADAFKMADDVLHSGVRGVTDLMVMPGLINLDFADIRAVMGEMGKAMMGTGEAEGDRRAIDAAEAAISNPLLEDVSMKGARGVLINITGGADMTLFEVDEAANRIREEVDPEANIIFGSTFDEKIAGRMRISVVATGIDIAASAQRPLLSLVGDRDMPSPASLGAAQMPSARPPGALPIAASAMASPAVLPGGDGSEPMPAMAQDAESAALRDGAFLAPRAIEPAIARQQVAPMAASDAFAAAAMENGGPAGPACSSG
jgi:cell division protein FtsZ